MFWIFLVLVAHFTWALENVYTKIVIGSKIKNPYIFLILITILSVLILPFIDYKYVILPADNTIWWLLLAGLFYNLAGFPYVKAMELEEVTRINILWNIIPIFSLILGWILIGDKISVIEFIAMIFLLTGAIIASLKKTNSTFKLSRAFWLMLLASLFYALYAIVIRHLSSSTSFQTIFFWTVLFDAIIISTIFIFKSIRKDFVQTIQSNSIVFFVLFFVVVIVSNIGTLLVQWSLTIKPAALVFSLEGFQSLFVFCLAIIAAKFSPKFIAESTSPKNLLVKFLAFLFVMVGVVLLAF
ncbi:MAG: hypothetical protein A2537_02195 [Candidatus Magasanikbacteria bacterium RIFOXYD2_FULL_36_9]|uniref:EamA domain-containing protein n=1 Tax=Candidatus Magasanikbacteria bacterium RIFOXYD2_FULL_36_9 TaxID=1798707 RepID=A0A1F6P0I2_9BACT|nr:MAG: hypothetical protein A2537_02195 [Candidatus Magasanikbacteria bacterium RIFOXYD2_FULL_36_9]